MAGSVQFMCFYPGVPGCLGLWSRRWICWPEGSSSGCSDTRRCCRTKLVEKTNRKTPGWTFNHTSLFFNPNNHIQYGTVSEVNYCYNPEIFKTRTSVPVFTENTEIQALFIFSPQSQFPKLLVVSRDIWNPVQCFKLCCTHFSRCFQMWTLSSTCCESVTRSQSASLKAFSCVHMSLGEYLAHIPALAWQTWTSCRPPRTCCPGKANSPYYRCSPGRPVAAAPALTVHTQTNTQTLLDPLGSCISLTVAKHK